VNPTTLPGWENYTSRAEFPGNNNPLGPPNQGGPTSECAWACTNFTGVGCTFLGKYENGGFTSDSPLRNLTVSLGATGILNFFQSPVRVFAVWVKNSGGVL
jgi:hypothetical protein